MADLWSEVAIWIPRAAALGALFAVDGRSFLHLAASQPLVVGVLSGWALGDAGVGLTVGAYLQLIWAYGFPRGRAPGPDAASGTIAAVVVALALSPSAAGGRGDVALAMAAAIGVASLGKKVEAARRRINGALSDWALEGLRLGRRGAIGRAQAAGIAATAAAGALTGALGSAVGVAVGRPLINLLAGMDFGVAFALIPCLGLASFIIGVMRAGRTGLAGFTAGLAAALILGLRFGLS